MAWVIVQFSDQTISCVPKKWLKKWKKVRMCYYPKTGAAKKIKAAVDVDVKSKEWKLYSCRLLMNEEEFDTYFAARKSEIIAQNHSTMQSFEDSYAKKQASRKRPIVHFGSTSPASSTGSEHQDFKNIKILSKRDAGLAEDMDKVYQYNDHPVKNNNNLLVDDSSEDKESLKDDDYQCSKKNDALTDTDNSSSDENDVGENDKAKNGSFIEEDEDGDPSIKGGTDISINDMSSSEHGNYVNEDGNSSSEDDENLTNRPNENNVNIVSQVENDFPLESTNKEHRYLNVDSVDSGYHQFSDPRRIPQIEKAVMTACQLLEENAKMVKEICRTSRETKMLVESFIPIVKDLTAEVFDSKEEIKKRNGLFTDVLAPKIKLHIKKVKQFDEVENQLKKHKIVDNMIKYLGSTISEPNENNFIKRCLDVVFEEKFFLNKVWWKKKAGKALIKHSMILHCIRESFKAKFGLVEPIRSDKEVNNLIHKLCRNVKDAIRKSMKAKEKELAAQQAKMDQEAKDRDKNQGNGQLLQEDEAELKRIKEAKDRDKNQDNGQLLQEDKAEQNRIKKAAKKAAKRAAEEIERNKNETISDNGEDDLNSKNEKFKENVEVKKSEKNVSKKATQAIKKTDLNEADQKSASTKDAENDLNDISGNDEKLAKRAKKQAKKLAKLEKAKQDAEEDKLDDGKKRASQEKKDGQAHAKKSKSGEKVKFAKKG